MSYKDVGWFRNMRFFFCVRKWLSQEVVDSWARCSPESCFDLFQSFAFCLRDESYGEDDVEDAHKSKQPEGSSTGQNILKEIPVQDIKVILNTVMDMNDLYASVSFCL